MNSAMIDLETLSTQPGAAVVSAGLAIFTNDQVIDTAGWALAPTSVHGHIDPQTVIWWMQQAEAAREFSFSGKLHSMTMGHEIASMLAKHNVQEVWAKDPDFDIVILKAWWARVSDEEQYNLGKFPIQYWQSRSYRTLEAMALRAGHDKSEWAQFNYVAHNPVDDATTQARAVIKMRQLLESRHV